MSKAKHDEYDQVRQRFYDYFQIRVLHLTGLIVEATPLEYPLLEQAMDWTGRRYQWDWFEIKRKFRGIPARFELAISVDGELCGLLVGKPSRGRRHISAYFLEGNPESSNPLKTRVLPIMLDGLAVFGDALGCQFSRLIEPAEGLIPKYQQAGFTLAVDKIGRLYCEKRLIRSQ